MMIAKPKKIVLEEYEIWVGKDREFDNRHIPSSIII